MFFDAVQIQRDKIKKLDQRVIINTILRRPEIKRFIIELITRGQETSQLFKLHVDANGVSLAANRGGYSDLTLKLSAEAGRPKDGRDAVNLHDKGDYYRSHTVTIRSLKQDFIVLNSNPNKGDSNLFEDWGEDILGLTDENKQKVVTEIKNNFAGLFLALS